MEGHEGDADHLTHEQRNQGPRLDAKHGHSGGEIRPEEDRQQRSAGDCDDDEAGSRDYRNLERSLQPVPEPISIFGPCHGEQRESHRQHQRRQSDQHLEDTEGGHVVARLVRVVDQRDHDHEQPQVEDVHRDRDRDGQRIPEQWQRGRAVDRREHRTNPADETWREHEHDRSDDDLHREVREE